MVSFLATCWFSLGTGRPGVILKGASQTHGTRSPGQRSCRLKLSMRSDSKVKYDQPGPSNSGKFPGGFRKGPGRSFGRIGTETAPSDFCRQAKPKSKSKKAPRREARQARRESSKRQRLVQKLKRDIKPLLQKLKGNLARVKAHILSPKAGELLVEGANVVGQTGSQQNLGSFLGMAMEAVQIGMAKEAKRTPTIWRVLL